MLRGLSQAALAAELRIDRSAVSKMESGRRGVGSMELADIARATGKPIEWFLAGELKIGRHEQVAPEGAGLLRLVRRERIAINRAAARHGARHVRVFGSAARGDAKADSDVDFLIEMDPGRSLLDQAALLLDLEAILARGVDVVTEDGLRERVRAKVVSEAIAL